MSKTPRSFVAFSVGSDVAVIFNNDANQWVEYVKNHLKKLDQSRDSVHVSINEDHDLFPRPHPNTLASLQNAKVIVVIASPGFLANLQRDEKRSCWIEDPTNAILFLCGVTEEDVRVSGLTSRFHSFDEWTKITHDKPEELFRHITASIDDFDNKSLPRDTTKARGSGASVASGDVGAPTPVAAGIETTAATDNDTSWVFDITPTVIHAEVRRAMELVGLYACGCTKVCVYVKFVNENMCVLNYMTTVRACLYITARNYTCIYMYITVQACVCT